MIYEPNINWSAHIHAAVTVKKKITKKKPLKIKHKRWNEKKRVNSVEAFTAPCSDAVKASNIARAKENIMTIKFTHKWFSRVYCLHFVYVLFFYSTKYIFGIPFISTFFPFASSFLRCAFAHIQHNTMQNTVGLSLFAVCVSQQ